MRFVAALVACSLTGCSFLLVKGPVATEPGSNPAKLDCTTSTVVPALDALGGAAAIAAAGAGLVLEYASEDGDLKNFKYYYAGPLLAVAIAYFWSASHGTNHVERCRELKERAGTPSRWQVLPIGGVRQETDNEPVP
ncbi:MAG: hypothetical protein H0T79_03840 [Deltaproteobacteria bacterium]|nr:hypothetical protein [Deltaproteobacteria bacterium]